MRSRPHVVVYKQLELKVLPCMQHSRALLPVRSKLQRGHALVHGASAMPHASLLTYLIMWSVFQLPRTFSPKLLSSSAA